MDIYMITLTNSQARQFILLKQGLLGENKFIGKQGALDFIRQAGCIQFDPIDICGKNAELTLQSRVKGFKYEDGVKQTKKLEAAVTSCLKNFALFNEVSYDSI